MEKKRTLKLVALVAALIMLVSVMAACAKPTPTGTAGAGATRRPENTTPLVVGYSPFSSKFSPFFADTAYDMDAVSMTQVSLLTTDRTGAIVYNAIEGEKHSYNGKEYTYKGVADVKVNFNKDTNKTVYNFKIRNDVKFSDGHVMDADDIIFTYYVLSDPTYNGSSTLYSTPIEGMQSYRTQTSDEIYTKFNELFGKIYAAGSAHTWSSADAWTQDQQTAAWKEIETAWKADVAALVPYVNSKYAASYAEALMGFKPEELTTDGLKTAFAMVAWGYGEADLAAKTLVAGDKTFDLTSATLPTVDDFYGVLKAEYGDDVNAYWATETQGNGAADVLATAREVFISTEGPKDPDSAGKTFPNISGIKKISQTEVEITVTGFDATAIYKLGGIQVAPMHYYGSESAYDYAANKFGFTYKNLDGVRAKTTQPLGAGPYEMQKFENKTIFFKANQHYYKGEPLTTHVQFKESQDADKIPGVKGSTLDITDPSFNKEAISAIKASNTNGELTGNVISTATVDFLGYGYIGMNAKTVSVGGVADSEASKNLRRGIATLLASYRELAVDSYYGDIASVINYPISNTSWAAPQKTDEGYKVAFSVDADGKDIYTSGMDNDAKTAAALQAAIGFFKKAGYTFDDASGKFTAAPAGAKLEYEVLIPADGKGDHPSFNIVSDLKKGMEQIGFNIIVNDLTNSALLWEKIDAGTQEIWCAAWGATIDPDMYQVYYSTNVVGEVGSTESNHYRIQDAKLDKLIMDARTSDDQEFRKVTYKAALDVIIDWAVEVPIYQRKECFIFNAERVIMDTVTPDMTSFWGWMNDIELLELKANK